MATRPGMPKTAADHTEDDHEQGGDQRRQRPQQAKKQPEEKKPPAKRFEVTPAGPDIIHRNFKTELELRSRNSKGEAETCQVLITSNNGKVTLVNNLTQELLASQVNRHMLTIPSSGFFLLGLKELGLGRNILLIRTDTGDKEKRTTRYT